MKWISVNERLPPLTKGYSKKDHSDDVLIWDGQHVGIGYYSTWFQACWNSYMEMETGYYGDGIHPVEVATGAVTHWMPLPKGPLSE